MQQNKFNEFRSLHSKDDTLILVNIWDAGSAAVVQNNGALALATSSASLAWSNGYADGSDLPVEVLMRAVSSILRVCNVPLTVDIEDGYSDSPDEVARLVGNLVELGISGINIEDGGSTPELLVEKITAIRSLLGKETVFINARTDVYLRELVISENCAGESITRSNKYIEAGADCAFVPGATSLLDISELSNSLEGPLNIMAPSNPDNLEELINAGANRISLGPDTFIEAYSKLSTISETLFKTSNHQALTYQTLNDLF